MLLTDDAVAEAFRIAHHLGDDGEHKRQTKTDTRTDDNRRHRRGQNDAEDGIFTAETKGPADVIKPLMNAGDASDGVDEHRPEYREDRDDHFGFQREAEQQKSDRCKRNPRHRPQNLDARQAVTPRCRRQTKQEAERDTKHDRHRPSDRDRNQGVRNIGRQNSLAGEFAKTQADGRRRRQIFVFEQSRPDRRFPCEADENEHRGSGPIDPRDEAVLMHIRAQWPGARRSDIRETLAAGASIADRAAPADQFRISAQFVRGSPSERRSGRPGRPPPRYRG